MNSYREAMQALEPAVGVPFKDLAPVVLGKKLPSDAKTRKAAGGDMSERLLDIAKNSIPKADLVEMGVEVKSVSLNTRSTPREWTKITHFNITTCIRERDFRRSSVFKKLRCILFIPIMKQSKEMPDFWYIRPPFLWLPSEEQLELMETDYDAIQKAATKITAVGDGADWTPLKGRPGRYLTLNVSGDTSKGKPDAKVGRAWWLTKDMTDSICTQNLWPGEAMEKRRQDLLGELNHADPAQS
jgi:DNA mismatch repair protein MutH